MLGIVKYEASKKLPTPRDFLFNDFLLLLMYYFIFLYLLLGLCGQLNKANKTPPLTLLKVWNAISSSLLKDLLSWVLVESLQRGSIQPYINAKSHYRELFFIFFFLSYLLFPFVFFSWFFSSHLLILPFIFPPSPWLIRFFLVFCQFFFTWNSFRPNP